MIKYSHTQRGTLIRATLGFGLVATAWMAFGVGAADAAAISALTAVFVVLAVFLLLFHALHVQVTHERVVIRFGIGLIRRRIALRNIRGARAVRNRWYYGWGIRLTPHGWLFNVSGLDAVELLLHDGRRFRIGTDEPDALVRAIETRSAPPT